MSGLDLSSRIRALADAFRRQEDLRERDDETLSAFRAWARNYDQRNDPATYFAPEILTRLAVQHLPPGAGPILDLACGTGLVGALLARAGFTDLTGIDLSDEMLKRAAEKRVYRQLLPANLHDPLPLPPASFAAITCCGTFYVGSVDVLALAHALPLLRPGGMLICDIESEAWQDGGYAHVLRGLQAEGALDILEATPIRMFRLGYLDPAEVTEAPQGMAVVARLAANPPANPPVAP